MQNRIHKIEKKKQRNRTLFYSGYVRYVEKQKVDNRFQTRKRNARNERCREEARAEEH